MADYTEKELQEQEAQIANILMNYSNHMNDLADKQSQGITQREATYHDAGWHIALHDNQGNNYVGLWSSWLKDMFYMGYPRWSTQSDDPSTQDSSNDNSLLDETIMSHLGVKHGKPVLNVHENLVRNPNYEGDLKDDDKPLEKISSDEKDNRYIAYKTDGKVQWARFFGPRDNDTGGRVWIDKRDYDSTNIFDMYIITGDEELKTVQFGEDKTRGVNTFEMDSFNKYSPDAPTTEPKAIQKYKDGFIDLTAKTACLFTLPQKLTIDYGFSMVPEDLEREDYTNIEWVRGEPGRRKGNGNELVKGTKEGEVVMIMSGDIFTPWRTIRQLDIPENAKNPNDISQIIHDSLTFLYSPKIGLHQSMYYRTINFC